MKKFFDPVPQLARPPKGAVPNWHFPPLARFHFFENAFENVSPPTASTPFYQRKLIRSVLIKLESTRSTKVYGPN